MSSPQWTADLGSSMVTRSGDANVGNKSPGVKEALVSMWTNTWVRVVAMASMISVSSAGLRCAVIRTACFMPPDRSHPQIRRSGCIWLFIVVAGWSKRKRVERSGVERVGWLAAVDA